MQSHPSGRQAQSPAHLLAVQWEWHHLWEGLSEKFLQVYEVWHKV